MMSQIGLSYAQLADKVKQLAIDQGNPEAVLTVVLHFEGPRVVMHENAIEIILIDSEKNKSTYRFTNFKDALGAIKQA